MIFRAKKIRLTYERLREKSLEFSETTYEIVLLNYPILQPIFKKVDTPQARKILARSFVQLIDMIEDGEELRELAHDFGPTLRRMKVKADHFEAFGEVFIQAIATVLEKSWSDNLAEQWTIVYIIIANHLHEAILHNKNRNRRAA